MDANNILTANLLDIIFEGKNKEYGAYELRKTYNNRISISLIITMGIISILLLGFVFANKSSSKNLIEIKGTGAVIQPPPPPIEPLPPPPPRIQPPPPPVATVAYLPPVVSKDAEVIRLPPDIDDILNAKIDIMTVEGNKDIGTIVAPPLDVTGTNVIATTDKKKNDDGKTFIPIEINASFPGGDGAWLKYIQREIEKNMDEFTEADFGTCVVKFMVDKTGKVSQVEAGNMKGTKLAEVAVNAIRKGPNWIPAQQNGSFVNAYRLQPVSFKKVD